MGDAAIHEVDFFHTGIQRAECGFYLGDHAAGDDAFIDELLYSGAVQGGDEGGRILRVTHHAQHVRDVEELRSAQFPGEGCSGDVGIHVQRLARAFLQRHGGDDRHFFARDCRQHTSGIKAMHRADETQVHRLAVLAFYWRISPAAKNIPSAQTHGTSALTINALYQVAVHFVLQRVLYDRDGLGICYAQTADEVRRESFLCHRTADGLAATVDDDGVNARHFHEDDVAEQALYQGGILHRAASEFYEERLTAKPLQIRQGFDQNAGFGDLLAEERGCAHAAACAGSRKSKPTDDRRRVIDGTRRRVRLAGSHPFHMGNWFPCPHCHQRYHFEPTHAGRAMACTACGYVLRVPPVPVSEPGAGEIHHATGGRWYLQFASGRKFGPVLPEMIAEWVREGRADGESLVCPDGHSDWYHLADAFPDLVNAEAPAAVDAAAPVPGFVEDLPASGLFASLEDEADALPPLQLRIYRFIRDAVEAEARLSMGAVRLLRTLCVSLPSGMTDVNGDGPRYRDMMRASHALVAEFAGQVTSFYLVVPWGWAGRMAHEFFSILPARLPHATALRRRSDEGFDGGQWIGVNGQEDDVVAVSARRVQDQLAGGIAWNWLSTSEEYSMVLVWGVQAIPMGPEKCLHLLQTASRQAPGQEYGILWYLERQSAFYKFARRLNVPDTSEPHQLFSSTTGQLLVLAVDRLAGYERMEQ